LAFESGSLPSGNFAELKNQSTKKPLIQGYVVTTRKHETLAFLALTFK